MNKFTSFAVEILEFENKDLKSVVTPVNVNNLRGCSVNQITMQWNAFLVDSFRNGFDIGYRGPTKIKRTSPNLKFRVGNEVILWNKVMKEVKLGRYTGPFEDPPFEVFYTVANWLSPKGPK